MTRLIPLLAVALVLSLAGVADACPMCKDAIPNSDAQSAGGLPSGFNLSIYYMLGGLFCVIAGFGYFVTKTIRATDRAHQQRGFPVDSTSRV